MTTLPISADGQAIALACSALALEGDRSLKPLTPTEWHDLSLALRSVELRPRDLVGVSATELRDTLDLGAPLAKRLAKLLSRGGQLAFEVERLASRGIWILTRADDAYPSTLKQRLRHQAPPLLFGAGAQAGLQVPLIAVVGSRDVDTAGISFASALGRHIAQKGFAVVSGAARGVDLAAMTGSMSNGGPAVGVTVDPLERLVRRRELRVAIADEQLTLATPFHPSARWHVGNAMRRNRLIYALAQGAVVVASSEEKGGTRSGALENLAARWVPLHVRDDGSPGNRRLIAEGAIPLSASTPVDELVMERLTAQAHHSLFDPAETPDGPRQRDQDPSAQDPGNIAAVPRVEDHRGEGAAGKTSLVRDDAFVAIWPILAEHLYEPVSEREVATLLKLELTQARAWLKRAVAEGLAEVRPRPKRYVLRDAVVEQLHIGDP